jgi:hypothetical protein
MLYMNIVGKEDVKSSEKAFAECFWRFAECPRHSANRSNPVVTLRPCHDPPVSYGKLPAVLVGVKVKQL